jgi:hypothetical protein
LPDSWTERFLFQGRGPALEDFDTFTALVEWTEEDQAPEHMLAKGKSFPGAGRCGEFRVPLDLRSGACIRELFGLLFQWL